LRRCGVLVRIECRECRIGAHTFAREVERHEERDQSREQDFHDPIRLRDRPDQSGNQVRRCDQGVDGARGGAVPGHSPNRFPRGGLAALIPIHARDFERFRGGHLCDDPRERERRADHDLAFEMIRSKWKSGLLVRFRLGALTSGIVLFWSRKGRGVRRRPLGCLQRSPGGRQNK